MTYYITYLQLLYGYFVTIIEMAMITIGLFYDFFMTNLWLLYTTVYDKAYYMTTLKTIMGLFYDYYMSETY